VVKDCTGGQEAGWFQRASLHMMVLNGNIWRLKIVNLFTMSFSPSVCDLVSGNIFSPVLSFESRNNIFKTWSNTGSISSCKLPLIWHSARTYTNLVYPPGITEINSNHCPMYPIKTTKISNSGNAIG
jgi:hypothetical protein